MATVKAPLYSLAAQGSVGKKLSFSTNKGVTTVYQYRAPPIIDTPAKLANQASFREGTQIWATFGWREKEYWVWLARRKPKMTTKQCPASVWTASNLWMRWWFQEAQPDPTFWPRIQKYCEQYPDKCPLIEP